MCLDWKKNPERFSSVKVIDADTWRSKPHLCHAIRRRTFCWKKKKENLGPGQSRRKDAATEQPRALGYDVIAKSEERASRKRSLSRFSLSEGKEEKGISWVDGHFLPKAIA